MWFRNLTLYRLPSFNFSAAGIHERLSLHAASPKENPLACGWLPVNEAGAFAFDTNGHILLSLYTGRAVLPAAIVKAEVAARVEAMTRQLGFKPNKRMKKEIKQDAIEDLLQKAFVVSTETLGWIDLAAGTLAINTSSQTKAETFVTELIRSFPEQLDIMPLKTAMNPVAAMTNWVIGEPPDFLTIDQDTTLTGASKASIKFSNQTLATADATHHIEAGKRVTSLAMTFNDKVSFVLDGDTKIRRVSALGVLMQSEKEANEHTRAADFMLMTSTLRELVALLVESLDGYYVAPVDPESDPEAAPVASASVETRIDVSDDPLYAEAVRIVRGHGRASISLVQRILRIGYNRAARLLEEMETGGVVSPMNKSGNRTVSAVSADA